MSIFSRSRTRYVFILLLVVMGAAGCFRPDDIIETDPPAKYVFPTTPDDLMANFVTAYTTRDVAGYGDLLHEDFIFSFQACDVAKLGLSKNHYTRADEIQTARNMFSGKAYHKSNGQVVPAITGINFVQWQQLGAWRSAEDSAPAGALRVSVECLVTMERQGAATIRVAGQSIFTALPVQIEVQDGVFHEGYQMLGWVDLTGPCGP